MKKLSIILVLVMLVGLFSSCDILGDGGLVTNSHTPDFELTFEPLPKREFRRGETFTVTTCVTNISGKDLTYSAVINSYYPTIELHSQDGGEVSAKITPEPIDTVSGAEEFTAKAGQVGKKTFTFIIPEDATPGVYSITLNYRGDVCTYNDAIIILDKLPHIYCDYTVASGMQTIKPISVKIGYNFYKDENLVFTEEIAGWQYIMSSSDYVPDEFPTLVLDDDGLNFEGRENVTHSSFQIYDTEFNAVEKLGDVNLLPSGEYIIVVIENVKTAADAPHSVVGEYDYKLTKSALVFKLIVR